MANRFFIIICGLPGTGKSTVAKLLAKRLRAKLFRTDSVRKKLFPSPAYTKKEGEKVYQTLFLNAQKTSRIRNIILDATFLKRRHRMIARRLAKRRGNRFIILETVCAPHTVQRRLEKRTRRNASDARFPHYLAIKSRFERIAESHLVVDTSKGIRSIRRNLTGVISTSRKS